MLLYRVSGKLCYLMADERTAQLVGNIEVVDGTLNPNAGNDRTWVWAMQDDLGTMGIMFGLVSELTEDTMPLTLCFTMMSTDASPISRSHAISLRQIHSPVVFLGTTVLSTALVSLSLATKNANVFPSFSFPMNM